MHQYFDTSLGMAIPTCLSFGSLAQSILSKNVISSSTSVISTHDQSTSMGGKSHPHNSQHNSLLSRDNFGFGDKEYNKLKSRYYEEECILDSKSTEKERRNIIELENNNISNSSSLFSGPMAQLMTNNTQTEYKPSQYHMDPAKTTGKRDIYMEITGLPTYPIV